MTKHKKPMTQNFIDNWLDNDNLCDLNLTSIGDGAFAGWEANTQPLVIPSSVKSISDYAFAVWEANYGFLIESEGYDYARYMAFIYKEALK